MNTKLGELLQQMLETELGGVKIYRTAIECAINQDLRDEWTKYLQQTQQHVEIVREILANLGIGEAETPGREVVRHIGRCVRGNQESPELGIAIKVRRRGGGKSGCCSGSGCGAG